MDSSFVHVDEAVAMGMTLLPENTTLNKAIARQWAYMGLRNIGPTSAWFQQCTLYPNDQLIMKKPDDMWKPIDIALYDSAGSEIRFSYRGLGTRIHTGRSPLVDATIYSPSAGAPVDLSEDDHAFHLGSNAGSVSYATIKYWQLPIDIDGLPKIPEGQVLAIAMFIRWMWTIKKGDNVSDRQTSMFEYKAERNKARAESLMPSGIEMEQIAKDWTSLIGAPMFKTF